MEIREVSQKSRARVRCHACMLRKHEKSTARTCGDEISQPFLSYNAYSTTHPSFLASSFPLTLACAHRRQLSGATWRGASNWGACMRICTHPRIRKRLRGDEQTTRNFHSLLFSSLERPACKHAWLYRKQRSQV